MKKFKNPENGCGHKKFSLEAKTIYWQVFSNGEIVGYVTREGKRPYYIYKAFDLSDRSLGIRFSLFEARKIVDRQLSYA